MNGQELLRRRQAQLAENILGFLNAYDTDYEASLLSRGKTLEQAQRLIGWDWTHGLGVYALFCYARDNRSETLLDGLDDWFRQRLAVGLPEKNVNTVCPLLTMAFLYERRPDPARLAVIREWSDWVMREMPRTEQGGIQHSHAELENRGQLWDDTLFMTVLFLAKAGRLLDRPDYVEEAEYQFLLHARYLTDRATGLWYHGWSFEERTHFAGALWGRGNCWVTLFVPEFLQIARPRPAVRRAAAEVLRAQVRALIPLQHESGMWHTLLDDDSSYLEASCTAGFCAGMFAGVRQQLLDESVLPCARRALEAVLNNLDEDGVLQNVSYGTNVGRTLEDYRCVPLRRTHYGQALALLALMNQQQAGH